jgi:hypothetical protein
VDELDVYSCFDELEDAKEVTLLVLHAGEDDAVLAQLLLNKSWLLDVCLDYFAVVNPFFAHAADRFGEDCAVAFRNGLQHVRWRREFESNRLGFRQAVEEQERTGFTELCSNVLFSPTFKGEEQEMREFFDSENGKGFFEACLRIREEFAMDATCAQVVNELIESPCLPHHPGMNGKPEFESLLSLLNKTGTRPSSVLIARSDEDEYTPKPVCDELESFVMEAVQQSWSLFHVVHINMEQ